MYSRDYLKSLDIEPRNELETPEGLYAPERFIEQLAERIEESRGYVAQRPTLDALQELKDLHPPLWLECKDVLGRFGLIRDVERLLRGGTVTALRGGPPPDASDVSTLVEAPIPDGCPMPPGWQLARGELHRVVASGDGSRLVFVAHQPPWLTCRYEDVEERTAMWRVSWRAGKRWAHVVVPRDKLLQARELANYLSGYAAAPVNSNTARDLVAWFVDIEELHGPRLPIVETTRQMGWQAGGARGFVAGARHVGEEPPVRFVGDDPKDDRLLRCLEPAGTLDGWLQAIRGLDSYPAVEAALYAALAPLFLEPLRGANFAVDWSHKTSAGKTTALGVAASVWGNPDPLAPDSLIASWDSTLVGFERRAAALSGLPLLVDDTRRARSWGNQSMVTQALYAVANGQGRSRGTAWGLAQTQRWRTILLSTGEERLVDFERAGGAAARCLSLWGAPFGEKSRAVGKYIRELVGGLRSHHGHAGEAVARWVWDRREDWDSWRDEHAALSDLYRDKLSAFPGMDPGAAERFAGYLGVLRFAALSASQAIALPWSVQDHDCLEALLPAIASGAAAVDLEERALAAAVSWAASNRERFVVSEEKRKDAPHNGWLGYWRASVDEIWDRLAFFKEPLEDFLEARGYRVDAILRQWAENGWLISDTGRLTSRIADLDGRPRMIVVTRGAAEDIGGLGGDDQEVLPF